MNPSRSGHAAGFTLIEVLVSALIMTVVLGSLTMALTRSRATFEQGKRTMSLEQRGGRVLRMVVDALRAADSPSIALVPSEPLSSDRIDYQSNLGFDGTQVEWSAPRQIAFDAASGTVTWTEDLGLPQEHGTAWCRSVPRFLAGEIFDGLDNNANGLVDEAGFCVTRRGNLLTIRLTIEAVDRFGNVRSRTMESDLFIRN